MKIQCIEADDIQSKVEYLQYMIIGFEIGASPPLKVIEGFFQRIWGNKGFDQVISKPGGVSIARFHSMMEHDDISKI